MGKTKAGGFYAVARGRTVGIYHTWDDCKAQVDKFPNARYKKFSTADEAKSFIEENRGPGQYAMAKNDSAPASCTPKPSGTKVSHQRTAVRTGFVSVTTPSVPSVSSVFQSWPPSTSHNMQKRSLSSLKVTDDRVINKRAKLDVPNSKANLENFTVDGDGYVVVFTDGACTKNGRKAAKAGIGVWFGDDHPLNISEPVLGRQTNNTAEIQAAERAIRQAKLSGINKLNVKTDSQFTINCVTKWLYNWKRNNWRLSSGGDVKNKEDLIKLDEAMQNMEIKWSYVAGHKGIAGNEAADRLAVSGAERA